MYAGFIYCAVGLDLLQQHHIGALLFANFNGELLAHTTKNINTGRAIDIRIDGI
ncbi:hypothetical protein Ngar_c05750 [Candidatus Nitrososphaera gargensis Ga9.2]|uniref:Uncharacterized protein n=1 Tax=Nitrososphaera gargensis (strain Ga9.2) TaxID=1237085 RepID=K0IFB2_NITGG|nr:hypothetical protein Ngar_c05750 [Candidatus Nitrososphaera gargensis Ga9.2]